jgi:hypothetical protein
MLDVFTISFQDAMGDKRGIKKLLTNHKRTSKKDALPIINSFKDHKVDFQSESMKYGKG